LIKCVYYTGKADSVAKKKGFAAANERRANKNLSLGIFTWLAIVEKEADKLSDSGRSALGCLREDLERLAK
jgi:hypothetical protein